VAGYGHLGPVEVQRWHVIDEQNVMTGVPPHQTQSLCWKATNSEWNERRTEFLAFLPVRAWKGLQARDEEGTGRELIDHTEQRGKLDFFRTEWLDSLARDILYICMISFNIKCNI